MSTIVNHEVSRTAIVVGNDDPSTRVDTIAMLVDAIAADDSLPARRRAEICSGVRSLCRVLRLQIESTPADPRFITERLKDVTPATARMSPGRLQNCRSLIDAAFAYADRRFGRRRNTKPLSPPYAALIALVPDRLQAHRLRRVFHLAAELGIKPEELNSDVFDRHLDSLEQTSIRDPRKHDREARKVWNELCVSVEDWPGKPVAVPSYVDHWALADDTFPKSLWDDVDAYLAKRTAKAEANIDDLLSDDELFGDGPVGMAATFRDSTAKLVRYRVRQFASALVLKGVYRAEEIIDLKMLVRPDVVNAGLKFFVERAGGEKRNSQIKGIASDLLMIAKHWVQSPPADLKKLKSMVDRTRPVHEGLPASARRALSAFRDLENVRAFLAMPEAVMAAAEKEKEPNRLTASRVATALWMKIAQRAPLRINNLMQTDLDANILRAHKGKGAAAALYYPPHLVKNGKQLEVPLPPRTVRMLDLYVAKYRPLLIQTPNTRLFPAENGGSKPPATMSTALQKLMREQLGFAINPHSFRHVAAKLYLTAHPGDYDTVQRILGHKNRQTTVTYYCELEAEEAFRHFDAVLLKLEEPQKGRP